MANVAQSAIQKAGSLIETAGRAILASQFPNDFEVYLCTLELADSKNNTIDFFTFPITPNAISKTEAKRENIRNTAGGRYGVVFSYFCTAGYNDKRRFRTYFQVVVVAWRWCVKFGRSGL